MLCWSLTNGVMKVVSIFGWIKINGRLFFRWDTVSDKFRECILREVPRNSPHAPEMSVAGWERLRCPDLRSLHLSLTRGLVGRVSKAYQLGSEQCRSEMSGI